MAPRCWMLIWLGWLLMGPALPARAAGLLPIQPQFEARHAAAHPRGGAPSALPSESGDPAPERLAPWRGVGCVGIRATRLKGSWPLLPGGAGVFTCPGGAILPGARPRAYRASIRGVPSSPRAPPSSC
jgi:hypothetical protein